jgi:hypothetical protein
MYFAKFSVFLIDATEVNKLVKRFQKLKLANSPSERPLLCWLCSLDIWKDIFYSATSNILTFSSRFKSSAQEWQPERVNQGELEPRAHVCTSSDIGCDSCLCNLLRLSLWGWKQNKPLENICGCLYDISAAILCLLCFGYLPLKWMAFKLLEKWNGTLHNFRTREPLLIFLNWLRHLSVIWRGL